MESQKGGGFKGVRGYSMNLFHFCCPSIVVFKVEADAFIFVVGVDGICALWLSRSPVLLADLLCLVHPAASANVLTIAAYPFGSGSNMGEPYPSAIIQHGNDLLSASPCVVGPCRWSVFVEVHPSFGGSLLGTFAHPLAPLLALVGWRVSFHKSARLLVV